MSKILSWGECRVFARKWNGTTKGTTWKAFDVPAEGTTNLETTAGEKIEAKVEGGENEAVRRKKNTYALSFNVRLGAGYEPPFADEDGTIEGEYEVLLVPMEDTSAPALYINKAELSASDSFNSTDGAVVTYTFDALKNEVTVAAASSGTSKVRIGQCCWGTATIDSSTNLPTKFEAMKDKATTKTNLLAA